MFLCSGTQYWINNSAKNGSPTNNGPGVIVPPEHSPIKINFDLLGDQVFTGIPYPTPYIIKGGWASFDQSTNAPIAYPLNTGQEKLSVRLSHGVLEGNVYYEMANPLLRVAVPFGGAADLQISTNKTDWTSLATVTNTGSIIRWVYYGSKEPVKFRVVPITP